MTVNILFVGNGQGGLALQSMRLQRVGHYGLNGLQLIFLETVCILTFTLHYCQLIIMINRLLNKIPYFKLLNIVSLFLYSKYLDTSG